MPNAHIQLMVRGDVTILKITVEIEIATSTAPLQVTGTATIPCDAILHIGISTESVPLATQVPIITASRISGLMFSCPCINRR